MRQPPHHAARRAAAFAIAALAAVLLAAILVESGQTPIAFAVRAYGPLAVLAALPLSLVAIALGRGPSRHALAIGVAYPTLCLAALWLALSRRYASGSEGSMDVLYAFLFPWFNTAWLLFLLLFLPAMVRLAIASSRAYRALPERGVGPIVGWAAVLLVAGLVVGIPAAEASRETPEYRPDVVDNAIRPLIECLWRVAGPGAEAGFPDSLQAIRRVEYRTYPTSANRYPNECVQRLDEIPHYPFDVRYAPGGRDSSGRARRFTLTFVEKTRPGGRASVVWYDETGLRRQAVEVDGRRDSVRLEGTSSLRTFLVVQRLIEEHAARGAGEYPLRIVNDHSYRSGGSPPPGVLAARVGECPRFADTVASCVTMWDRALVYVPLSDPSGRRSAYTLTMLPLTYNDYERDRPIPSRTHHRDVAGVLHSFGGWRPADGRDPPPADDELAAARDGLRSFLEERARDSVRAEQWRRQRDSLRGERPHGQRSG